MKSAARPGRRRRPLGESPASGSLAALGAAALAALALVVLTAADPAAAVRSFFAGPWSSAWFVGNTLDKAALLVIAGLGVAVAFRAGAFNLGGEGQLYLGGLAAAVVLGAAPDWPAPLAWAAAAAAALSAGAAMAALAGWMRTAFGADEAIASFLVSLALTPTADYLISGPWRDPSGSLLAMPRLAADRLLPKLLEPSSLNVSAPIAVALALAGAVLLRWTAAGFRLKIAAASPGFARFAGIDQRRYWTPAMALSGALHGLAGLAAVAGTYGLCHRGFSGGLGWGALAVALIARNQPLALVPAALVYAALAAGADAARHSAGMDLDAAPFVQAAVFLLVTARLARRGPGRPAR